jgi:UDP-N-acetylglucosamine 2-epimerase (non-hydrolysing)
MKIVSIIGARPQFIKCAPLSRAIRKDYSEIILHTGQHYDAEMSSVFFNELHIPEPDYNLSIGSGSHGEQTGRMLMGIEEVLLKERPELVIVYGDTNSTLAGALAASKLNIPIAHIEAGLRSFDRTMPEEINRILTDHVSDMLFCPTKKAVINLETEGIQKRVYDVGDVMMDAILYNQKLSQESSILDDLGLTSKDYLLTTIHRASNTDKKENLSSIIKALKGSCENIVFPVHPRTRNYLKQYGLWEQANKSLTLIPPVGYLDMLKLMANAKKILTDSGGVQKEAYMLKVPCITLRDTTEWVETVDAGWNSLVGADYQQILDAIRNVDRPTKWEALYGNGNASEKIIGCISDNIL